MSEPKRNAPRPHGPGRGMMPTEKAKDFKGSFKKLISYLSPFKFKILIVVIFAALSTVFTIVGPKILAKATDELTAGLMRIITGAAEGIDFGYIAKVLLFLVGLYALSALFSYIQGFTMSGVSAKVSYNMRRAIMEKIDRLPVSYFHKTSQGDVLSRITNDVDTLSQSLNQSITQLITSVCSIIGVLIMMLSISWQLTLVALCIVPISLLLVGRIVKSSQKYFVGQQEYLGAVNGHVEEMYGVIQTAGAKQLPSQAYSIVPIVAARCMSTAPTMASGFLNIPVPIIPKFRVGHYALHNTVSMRVLF